MANQLPGLNPNALAEHHKAHKYGRSRIRDKTFINILHRFGQYAPTLLSDLNYDDGNNEDWFPVRGLGIGGFGCVSHWVKRDMAGGIVDELAMKDADGSIERLGAHATWAPHLVKEAFVQSQLTENDRQSFVNLKQYKYYVRGRRFRLYMEYAASGSLERIRRNYRAWDVYLPELFLWTVFHELATACRSMYRCPAQWRPYSPRPQDQQNPANQIIHMDLKADNVFIFDRQRPNPNNVFPAEYPQVKVADFGLAQVTSAQDPSNPRDMWRAGDQTCQTPEQYEFGRRFGIPDPVNGGYGPAFRFFERQNVWQVAKIIFDLMTLENPEHIPLTIAPLAATHQVPINILIGLLQSWQQPLNVPRQQGPGNPPQPVPRHHFMDWPDAYNTTVYSNELRALVWRCMKPRTRDRPNTLQLLNLTRNGLSTCLQTTRAAAPGGRGRGSRVARTNRQMNARRPGENANAMRRVDIQNAENAYDWDEIREQSTQDPDQPRLQPPRRKWQAFYDEEAEKPELDEFWEEWRQFSGQAHHPGPDGGRPRPRRIRSFDASQITDPTDRAMCLRLQAAVMPFAANKPIAMIEYVIHQEKMDEEVALEVLRWMYIPRARANDQWRWARNESLLEKARLIKQRCAERNDNECLYVVATTARGFEHVDTAVDVLSAIYNIKAALAGGMPALPI